MPLNYRIPGKFLLPLINIEYELSCFGGDKISKYKIELSEPKQSCLQPWKIQMVNFTALLPCDFFPENQRNIYRTSSKC